MRTCRGRKQPKLNDIFAMSIFHLTVKRGSRSENRLSVDKHDYIMRLGRFAERHDGELAFGESGNMPSWAVDDPRKFWVETDECERANGTLYHEVEFALPLELSFEQQISATRENVRLICGDEHPYSWGLHFKEGNPHVHLEFSGRMLDDIDRDADQFFKRYNAKNPERGGCRKESSGDARGPDWVKQVRKDWQDTANRHLAAAGQDARIDHRSNKDRGLDEAPGVHLGRHATRLEMRGKSTWRGNKNRGALHLNASLREIRSQLKEKEYEQHPGRNGKPHNQRRADGRAATAAPKRAFTAWRDRAEDREGLRTSRRAGPERMPVLRQPRPGNGQQEARNSILQIAVSGPGSLDRGMHGVRAGGLYCVENLDRRQQFKCQLLTQQYNAQVSDQLANRLLFIDRQPGQTINTLRDRAGAVGGRVIDKGDRLTCGHRGTDAEILAMVDLAKVKNFKQIHITGTESFKARAYIEAARAGLTVVGYEPSPELRAQLEKEKNMTFGQAGAGAMTLTPDAADAAVGQSSPASRWLDPLRVAREKLEVERRAAKEKLSALPLQETNLEKLELELAAAHGGTPYREALHNFKSAAATEKDAGVFTRRRAEAQKEKAWQVYQQAHARALVVPAAAQRLAAATKQNQEREQLTAALIPLHLGVGEMQYLEREIEKGRDPEAEFLKAWKSRKFNPLKQWQELVIAPVFEADVANEKARLQAESDAVHLTKQAQRQEQIQSEIAAQQQADAIQDQLGQPGLTAKHQELLEQQQRYFQALADGHDEDEAKERASKKSNAPRP